MRWNLGKMWASLIVAAMLCIAFVGSVTQTQKSRSGYQVGSSSDTREVEGTRGPGVPRVVLLERFTNVNCPPCAPASENEEIFTNDHRPDQLAVIKYHVWWPSDIDPMFLNNDGNQRLRTQYYGVPYVPYGIVDGLLVTEQPDNYPIKYDTYYRFYKTRAALPSPFSISTEGSLGASTGTLYINITAVDAVPAGNLKLRVVLWFNNVDYPAPPGSNGESHFEFVFMDFIPDINGRDLIISTGETVEFVETFPIPNEIAAGGGDPAIPVERAQLGVVAFVQDNGTKEVHQASVLPFADLAPEPMGIMLVPSDINSGDLVGISVRVKNNGEDLAHQVYVSLYVDQVGGDPVASAGIGAMVKGEMQLLPLGVWDTTGFFGAHRLYVVVDSKADLWEYDESNNVAMRDVIVKAQFDVGISQPNPFGEGGTYPMSNYSMGGVVENFGQNSLGDFDVGIELVQLEPPDVPNLLLSEDFETGKGGWTENSAMSSWEYGIPAGPGPHSGTNVWATTLLGDYPTLAHDWLMSPIIDLPTEASSITLDFWHFYDFQSTTTTNPPIYTFYNDCGVLWISFDSGESWVVMDQFVEESGGWIQEVYDLSLYAGETIRLGFELASDRYTAGGDVGWYLDDVNITAMLPTETLIWSDTARMSAILASGESQSMMWKHKIASGGTYKLYVWTPIGGDQNVANDKISVTFSIDPSKWRNAVFPGATLISSPLILSENNIANIVAPVQSTLDSVRYYSGAADEWYEYSTTKPYSDLTTVDHKMGMWVIADTNTYIDFSGSVPGAPVTIDLSPGWNLVGYPSMTDRTVADALSSVPYERVEGYDPATPYYLKVLSDSDWMSTGNAYWIYLSAGGTWTIL